MSDREWVPLVGTGSGATREAVDAMLARLDTPHPLLVGDWLEATRLTCDGSATPTLPVRLTPVAADETLHMHRWQQRRGWRRERCECGAERRQ